MPRKAISQICSDEDLDILKSLSVSRTVEVRIVERAKIVLKANEGLTDTVISKDLGISLPTVGKWRRRYINDGIEGLNDLPRSGKPPVYDPVTTRNDILTKLEETPPKGQAQWDGKALAAELNMSDDKVYRVLRAEGICLQRRRSWCVSKDPNFAQKAADVVNIYTNPPEGSIVLSLDEKPGIQAIERPNGYVRTLSGSIVNGYKSTYTRHGTLNMFAALEISTGRVITSFSKEKKRVDFLKYMDKVVKKYPKNQEIHVVMDNYCIHKNCDEWLKKHPTVFFHFTPTSSSWMNLVEIWFGHLTRKALRGGTFKNLDELSNAITDFITVSSENAKPYVWKKREVHGSQLRNTIKNLCN